ncbi:hypothetical protein PF003_g3674 [Phytophthora fragariae]|nr:hypothetical protein PF003_g3674 [Phytophthora fragariae]
MDVSSEGRLDATSGVLVVAGSERVAPVTADDVLALLEPVAAVDMPPEAGGDALEVARPLAELTMSVGVVSWPLPSLCAVTEVEGSRSGVTRAAGVPCDADVCSPSPVEETSSC